MLKMSSKRRRTRKQIEEEKQAEVTKRADMQRKMAFFEAAEEKLAQFDTMAANVEKAKSLMLELQGQGMISIDDNIHAGTLSSKDALRILYRLAAHWAPRQL